MTSEEMIPYFKQLAVCNPNDDPHGMMDRRLCDAFAAFLVRSSVPEDAFTKESWRELCKARGGADATMDELHRAKDAETFVYMVRDFCVFTSGCNSFVMTLFNIMLGEL